MNQDAAYTPYHPRWHRTPVSTYWWLGRTSYFVFILRELSSVAVAWFVTGLLLMARAVGSGPAAYQEFLARAGRPAVLTLNAIAFAFIILHAITWFNLAPQAMVVHVAGRRVPGWSIAASNYAALVVVTVVLAALFTLEW